MLYLASGSSDDWAHLNGISLSFTVELRDTGKYNFELPKEEIDPERFEICFLFCLIDRFQIICNLQNSPKMCRENIEGLRAIYEYVKPKGRTCNSSICDPYSQAN